MEFMEEEKRLEAELSCLEESARASQKYPQRMTVQMNGIMTSEDPTAEDRQRRLDNIRKRMSEVVDLQIRQLKKSKSRHYAGYKGWKEQQEN